MAQNLTGLPERTVTADTDLMHINSGGMDYKETKANFLKGDLYHVFSNASLLTSQVDALPATATYFGGISSYGHQSETGVPLNYSFYVKAEKVSSGYAYIELWSTRDAEGSNYASGGHYIATEHNGTWSEWTKVPTRLEIDSIFKRIVLFNFNLASGGTAKHSLADHVPYGNQSGVVFLQPRGFTVNNISKIYMFRFNQAKTACYFTDVTSGVTSSLSARLDSDGNFYNTSTEYSVTYDCALFLLYY